MAKLIVIRANSGSGKTTIAKLIHVASKNSIIIEQDYYIKYTPATKTAKQENARKARIFHDIETALDRYDTVIIEGVFDSRRYSDNFTDLLAHHPHDNYFFYIDVSFEETLRRHQLRDKRHEFGEAAMSNWYAPHDTLRYPFEVIIDETTSIEGSVEKILQAID